MTLKKMIEKKNSLELQIEKFKAKIRDLEKEHNELSETIKQAQDAEIIAYIDNLGITHEQAMNLVQKMGEEMDKITIWENTDTVEDIAFEEMEISEEDAEDEQADGRVS